MTVTIYSTASCAACHTLTQWLDSKEIEYTKHVVDEDPQAMEQYMKINEGMIGVPFTVIEKDGETKKFTGFERKDIGEALGIN